MKKQGFTLIELMVVIVIMGILDAVAVPKLFGMIAKSKASEVGPAAGTYVKLQQAYFSESSQYGGWELIGYVGPGDRNSAQSTYTTNFEYDGSALASNSTSTAETAGAWKASNRAKLNDCGVSDNWKIKLNAVSEEKDSYEATVTGTGCEALTPTFAKIGK